MIELHCGDCLEVMKTMPDNSVDAVVTDPPYELGFMGKAWDASGIAYNVDVWRQALRVLKPGGHLLAFGGSRTYHRMACAIEDAEFETRDMIEWVYGSGFPKSLNISKALDKAAGAEREVIKRENKKAFGYRDSPWKHREDANVNVITAPATPEAKQWDGWGTALKPAHEPICVARKPFKGTVAGNVLEWGTGGINIDGCRVGTESHIVHGKEAGKFQPTGGTTQKDYHEVQGRFPANLILDEDAGRLLGEFSRFFYCPKASKRDRDEGLEGMDTQKQDISRTIDQLSMNGGEGNPFNRGVKPVHNYHPTVKPTDLMRYLCRLVTPPQGVILDPFCGSGSTGKAAVLEGFSFIGIEIDPNYFKIAQQRIAYAQMQPSLITEGS